MTKVPVTPGLGSLKTAYDQIRINFSRSVDRSDCVSVAKLNYLCRCWARMSPVFIIGNCCDSTFLSNPSFKCDRRFMFMTFSVIDLFVFNNSVEHVNDSKTPPQIPLQNLLQIPLQSNQVSMTLEIYS